VYSTVHSAMRHHAHPSPAEPFFHRHRHLETTR
jgi:hypothetical protein